MEPSPAEQTTPPLVPSVFSRCNLTAAVTTVAGVIAIIVTFYGPFLNNFFAFDDFRYIENLFSTPKALLFGYNTTRFLSNLVFAPLYALSGFNPVGYNLFSLLLHITNTLLFAALATRLSGRMLVGMLTGILFASSAALADAVLWKCANNSLMSACFSLLTFHTYLNWRDSGKSGQRIVSLVLFTAAMFSKEDAAALPFLIICYELVFKERGLGGFRLAMPYAGVVLFYLCIAQLITRTLHVPLEHYERFLSFRPFYALLAGFSAFLMDPAGIIASPGIAIAAVSAVIAGAFIVISDRRLLFFVLLGIIFTFLPSSLTSLGSFTPKHIFQSISRYLYLPSAMAALLLACFLGELPRRIPKRLAGALIVAALCLFIGYNYRQVSKRGNEWHEIAEPVRGFLKAMQNLATDFPRNSYVYVIDPPTGRAYVQQSLRAFYKNPTITWITDPQNFTLPPGSPAFIIICDWLSPDYVMVRMLPF